jgi:tetratricopeptide (TPR) repeat protein
VGFAEHFAKIRRAAPQAQPEVSDRGANKKTRGLTAWLVGFAEYFARIRRAAPQAQPEVSIREANEKTRGLAAPRSAASEAPPVAAEGPPSPVLPALKKAEAASSVASAWFGAALESGSLAAAANVVESCRDRLRLPSRSRPWSVPEALEHSAELRKMLHVTQFYRIEELCAAAHDELGAERTLRAAIVSFPSYSGPSLRLAARLVARGEMAAAALCLQTYLDREPGDLHAALDYVRLATRTGQLCEVHRLMTAAVVAGAPVESLLGPWIDYCVRISDMSALKVVIGVCAPFLGLGKLRSGWTWPQVLQKSATLRKILHISHYLALDKALAAAGKSEDADAVLAQASLAYPRYSTPVLILAERRLAVEDRAGARKLLGTFLKREPGDLHAAVRYARLPMSRGEERERARILAESVKAGVAVTSLVGPWVDACFSASDLKGARRVIEICADAFGLDDLEVGWSWPEILGQSSALRAALHLTHYYHLDTALLAEGDRSGSLEILRLATATYPDYSGPALRLCERYLQSGDQPAAETLIAEFLRRHPGDIHAEAFAARIAQQQGLRRLRLDLENSDQRKVLQRRLAFCYRLVREGRHAERALAVLTSLLDRFVVDFDRASQIVLPRLFETYAFDLQAMRHLMSRLVAPTGQLRRALPRSPEFGFVRGTAAFYAQDMVLARRELTDYAQAFPSTRAALAAKGIVAYLDSVDIEDSDYVAAARGGALLPELSSYDGKRVLVISEAEPHDVEPVLLQMPKNAYLTVIFSHSRNYGSQPPDASRMRYILPNLYVWYSDDGTLAHRRFEQLTEKASHDIAARFPRFAGCDWALKAFLTDNGVYDYAMFWTMARELAAGANSLVLAVTRRYSIYRVARELGDRLLGPGKTDVAWISQQRTVPPPAFIHWPAKSVLWEQFLRMRVARRQNRALGRPFVPVVPARITGPHKTIRPALLVWSIGEINYDYALRRVIETILPKRPVIVLLFGDTDARVARLAFDLEAIVRRCGNRVQLIRYDDLLRLGRARGGALQAILRRVFAGAAVEVSADRDAPPIDAAFLRYEMTLTMARSVHLNAMAAALDTLDTIFATLKPAYLITAPGRSSFPAMVAEYVQQRGLDAVDVHMYFPGNSARQMRPPHRFNATIDSLLERFLIDKWGIDSGNLIRVGYLWQRTGKESAKPATAQEIGDLPSFRQTILLATQPAPPPLTREFMGAFLRIVAGLTDCGVWLKPHPKEVDSAITMYHAMIAEYGLEGRVVMIDLTVPVAPMIARADVVVTRTSNAGLEAAQMGKPVVRGVFLDRFLSPALLEAPYAFNARTPEEMNSHVVALLTDPEARARLEQSRTEYFAQNPLLLNARGPERLVAFMEDRLRQKGEA